MSLVQSGRFKGTKVDGQEWQPKTIRKTVQFNICTVHFHPWPSILKALFRWPDLGLTDGNSSQVRKISVMIHCLFSNLTLQWSFAHWDYKFFEGNNIVQLQIHRFRHCQTNLRLFQNSTKLLRSRIFSHVSTWYWNGLNQGSKSRKKSCTISRFVLDKKNRHEIVHEENRARFFWAKMNFELLFW